MIAFDPRAIWLTIGSMILVGSAALAPRPGIAGDSGQAIFAKRCSSCHGAKGEGGSGYGRPLVGGKSLPELTQFIAQNMPPSGPKLAGSDAATVAKYVYNSFYSAAAQLRNNPARILPSRLTVDQYRNAVADLVGDYHPVVPAGDGGLRGEYFLSKDLDGNTRAIDRIDPQIDFDFGTHAPAADKFDPHRFSIAWSGSVLAPDTGDYDFVLRSDQSVRLWLNGQSKPLIDAWIKSGSDTEFTGSANLLGGRAYQIRVEFSKGGQGVDDPKKAPGPPTNSHIQLLWRRPNHELELIPSFCLFKEWINPTFVIQTHFPPDDRSTGYERGTSVSKDWQDATTSAALEVADYVSDHLKELSGVAVSAPDRPAKLEAFATKFVERAFRRPLTPELRAEYVEKQFAEAKTPEMGVKRSVAMALLSPRFLYMPNDRDPYSEASRLSFALWDAPPDPELMRAAAAGDLSDPSKLRAEADRMAQDQRAWNKLRSFLLFWLKIDEPSDIVKDPKEFPDFNPQVASDLRTSMELFLQSVAWSKEADYRQLMLSHEEFLNARLAKLYGATVDGGFQAVEAKDREGVLTQPYLLARFGYVDSSDPIHRGVLIVRNMLGRTLNPPPAAQTPLPASLHPGLTTRERVALQTKPAACTACHGMINPLGFTLEEYDAIGRVRNSDDGKPVDTSGHYVDRTGKTVEFKDSEDLLNYLANSDEAHSAFVERLFVYMIKQPPAAYGLSTSADLREGFEAGNCNIRGLMTQIALATCGNASSEGKG